MPWKLTTGDCRDVLLSFPGNHFHACVTDPPYGLSFMGKDWDHAVPGPEYWEHVFRVLRPGAPLLAMGGAKKHHRLMVAIEDAGFEIRDCLSWLYGQGFPKNHDISKGIDKAKGATRKVVGVKPGHEDFAGRSTHGHVEPSKARDAFDRPWMHDQARREQYHLQTTPGTEEAALWEGWGTALKPAWEPIVLAQKPLDGTFAQNALQHGVAGLNIDATRIPFADDEEPPSVAVRQQAARTGKVPMQERTHGTSTLPEAYESGRIGRRGSEEAYLRDRPGEHQGRWPANVLLDAETAQALGPERRFFYTPKASRREKTANGTVPNRHPTVKPLQLMRWLVRLVSTPTDTIILDPFAGSGTTGVAAIHEGLSFHGIELDPDHADTARQRLRHAWASKEQP